MMLEFPTIRNLIKRTSQCLHATCSGIQSAPHSQGSPSIGAVGRALQTLLKALSIGNVSRPWSTRLFRSAIKHCGQGYLLILVPGLFEFDLGEFEPHNDAIQEANNCPDAKQRACGPIESLHGTINTGEAYDGEPQDTQQ